MNISNDRGVVSNAEIVRTLETSSWDYEPAWRPPGLVYVERPDLTMWATDARTPYANKVVRTLFAEASAEQSIDEVLAFFKAQDRPFSWDIGPSTRPPDLADRLRRRGFVETGRYDGLAKPLDEVLPSPAPEVVVERVETAGQVRELVEISGHVFGYASDAIEELMAERLAYLSLPERRGGYLLARVQGRAAGNAAWRDSADGTAVYLTGGATMPQYRRWGVYSALLTRRLLDARERGAQLATVWAREETSSPILRRRGFSKHCELNVLTLAQVATPLSASERVE